MPITVWVSVGDEKGPANVEIISRHKHKETNANYFMFFYLSFTKINIDYLYGIVKYS